MHFAYLARLLALMSIVSVVAVSASPAHHLDTRDGPQQARDELAAMKEYRAKHPTEQVAPQGTSVQPPAASSSPKASSGLPLGLLDARKVTDSALSNAVPANLASDNLMNAATNALGSAGAKRRVATSSSTAGKPKSVDATELTLSRPASLAGSLLQAAPAARGVGSGLLSGLTSQQSNSDSSPAGTSLLGLRDATKQVKKLAGSHASSVSPSALSQVVQIRDSEPRALGFFGDDQAATKPASGNAMGAAQPLKSMLLNSRDDAQLQIQAKRMAYVRSNKKAKGKHAHKSAAEKTDKSASKSADKTSGTATSTEKTAPSGAAASSAAGKTADGSTAKTAGAKEAVKGHHKMHTMTKRTEVDAAKKHSHKKVKAEKKGAKSHTTA